MHGHRCQRSHMIAVCRSVAVQRSTRGVAKLQPWCCSAAFPTITSRLVPYAATSKFGSAALRKSWQRGLDVCIQVLIA